MLLFKLIISIDLMNKVASWPTSLPANASSSKTDDNPQIVGGTAVYSNSKYPFITSLQDMPMGPGQEFCGGSLIAPNIILTAAHCTDVGNSVQNYGATACRYNLKKNSSSEGGIDFKVLKWIVHPKYDNLTFENDISLWVVNVTNNWGNNPLPIVNFSKNVSDLKTNQTVSVIGWGSTTENEYRPSNNLMKADVNVVNNTACQKMYRLDPIFPSNMCAGLPEGGKDTCQGDSGGPLFTVDEGGKPLLHGLTSRGDGCARKGKPGIYTRVASYVRWIESNIKKYSKCSVKNTIGSKLEVKNNMKTSIDILLIDNSCGETRKTRISPGGEWNVNTLHQQVWVAKTTADGYFVAEFTTSKRCETWEIGIS